MTAWQDQPPLNSQQLSRRQLRQNERGEAADVQVDVAHQTNEQPDFAGFAREGWDTEARRVAAAAPAVRDSETPPTGRRSQRALQPVQPVEDEAQSEPLTYLTQGRPQAPSTDGQTFRRRSVSAVPDAEAEQPAYRVRDFSPEGRRSSFSATVPEAPAAPADLEYRTEGSPVVASPSAEKPPVERPSFDLAPQFSAQPDAPAPSSPAPSSPAPSSSAPISSAPISSAPVEERTLSRRQLRALENARAAQSADAEPIQKDALAFLGLSSPVEEAPLDEAPRAEAQVVDVPADEAPAAVAPEIPELVEPLRPWPDEAPPLRRDRSRPFAQDSSDDNRAAEALAEFDALTGQSASAPEEAPGAAAHEPSPADTVAAPSPEEVNPFDSLLNGGGERRGSFTPPVGHWSTQASIDDDEQVQENTLSRNVGATSGAITTNALVIPSMPLEDALKPFGSTGEILITGSIDLPRSLGATGAHPARYDHSDVDALLEAGDREDSHPDSAPVRAIRAVSTHTSTRGVMDAKKPKGGNSRLPMILAVAAAAMAVGVVVLVVAGMIFGIFK